MKIKLFVLFAVLAFGSFGLIGTAGAQTAAFPAGCSSGWGYSVTTGDTCSGEDEAITFMPGCATPLGYSRTNGDPCSGGDVALSVLIGCSSLYGYSIVSGLPCNGTATPAIFPGSYVPAIPGLPTTGMGGEALVNLLFLSSSALIAVLGMVFLSRGRNVV